MNWLKRLPTSVKILCGVLLPFFLASVFQIVSVFFVDPRNNDGFIAASIVYCFCGLAGFSFFLLIEVKHKLVVMTLVGVVFVPLVAFILTFYSYFFCETFFNTALGGFLMKLAYRH